MFKHKGVSTLKNNSFTSPGIIAVLIFLLVCFLTTGSVRAADNPVVSTLAGQVKGYVHPDQGILTFKGLHYGEPTGGVWRFKPPQPVASWSGTKDAMDYGPTCPQTGNLARGPAQSEDCLVLNVFTPRLEGKRPVMVWLHGGGFASGSGSQAGYDGTALAKRGDVVVVTINHRLNVFGYLYLEEIGGEAFDGSGMAGMLDIELALKWIRDNISAFGGDPENVTVFGESGGGMKVSMLLAMPSSKGLFHKGIIQSGPGIRGIPKDQGTKEAKDLMTKMKIDDPKKLQEVPVEDLLKAISVSGEDEASSSLRLSPVVDGKYLPVNPFEPVAAPTGADIPIIVGTNKDEALLFVGRDPMRDKMTEEDLVKRLTPMLGAHVNDVIGAYKKSRPDASPWDLFIAISTESFRLGSIILAERKVAGGTAPVYMYLFDFEINNQLKAAHAMEIAFVFSNASSRGAPRPEVKHLETLMSEAWIAFAKTGNPNVPGTPHWPAYTTADRATMVFNTQSCAINDPRREERLAWKGIDLRRLRR